MEVDKNSTEFKIIYATLTLLNEKGLTGITTKKIAEEAGVSEITIFRKFETKKKLLETVQEIYAKEFIAEIEEILEFDEDVELEEYLRDVWKKGVELSDKHLIVIRIALEEIRGVPLEKKVLPKFANKIKTKLVEFFELQIAKGNIREINTNVAALTIFSVLFEAITLWKVYGENPKGDVDSYLNGFLDIFINGIIIKPVI